MADVPEPAPTVPLTGQDINLAATATRRVLIASLAPLEISFEHWTVINQVGSGRVADKPAMAALFRSGLQLDDAQIEEQFAGMAAAQLIERTDDGGGALTLTAHGRAVFDQGSAVVADIIADLYTGFAPEDLARARAILVEITARAEARLASAA